MDIDWLRAKIRDGDYQLSSHACEECDNESISLQDIERAVLNGKILERYSARKDVRGEVCLVLGRSTHGGFIHIVVARSALDEMRVVTAYLPRPPKWVNERTRRAK